MNDIFINIIAAISIGVIILVMSLLKSGYLKAIIYSLPIPITIALVATGGKVNETNVIGLFILIFYLWGMVLFVKRGMNIYVADIVAAVAYILLGYVAITYIKISFETSLVAYGVSWLGYAILYRHKIAKVSYKIKRLNPLLKFPIVTVGSFVLLSLKSYLAGIVVTFPFSGVFAVIESRDSLRTLAAMFTRNSIGILAMFATVHYMDSTHLVVKIIAGWISYLGVIFVVSRIVKYAH